MPAPSLPRAPTPVLPREPGRKRDAAGAGTRLLVLLAFCASILAACAEAETTGVLGGNPAAGREALAQYACHVCHRIPGIIGAIGHVGPPLAGIAERKYLAGVLRNTPENMLHWIRHPQEVDPLTTMPDMGVSEDHARDIVAYLYTLRDS